MTCSIIKILAVVWNIFVVSRWWKFSLFSILWILWFCSKSGNFSLIFFQSASKSYKNYYKYDLKCVKSAVVYSDSCTDIFLPLRRFLSQRTILGFLLLLVYIFLPDDSFHNLTCVSIFTLVILILIFFCTSNQRTTSYNHEDYPAREFLAAKFNQSANFCRGWEEWVGLGNLFSWSMVLVFHLWQAILIFCFSSALIDVLLLSAFPSFRLEKGIFKLKCYKTFHWPKSAAHQ